MKTTNDKYPVIGDILFFVNNHRLPESLVTIEKVLGENELRIVSIKLLGWLKYQCASRQKRSLNLNNNYKWCNGFRKWLLHHETMSNIFTVNNDEVDFQNTVTADERNIIRELVDQEYKPRLRDRQEEGPKGMPVKQ